MRGFTLIEVLLIVIILGIVGVTGQSLMSGSMDDAYLSSAAGEVMTAFRFAQSTSIRAGRQCRVTIDAAGDSILVEELRYSSDLTDTTLSTLTGASLDPEEYTWVEHPLTPDRRYHIDFTERGRFGGVEITEARFGVDNWVVFDDRGEPSSSGSVTLALGGQRVRIRLGEGAGIIKLEELPKEL